MKFTTIAQAALMATAAEALLDDLLGGIDINLPIGIDIDLDIIGETPTEGPCDECTNMYHPPHDVIIDDCDDMDSHGWHWVHPCPEPHEPSFSWSTSTVTATHVSTIIDCGPEVPDCPGQSTVHTTVTVTDQTTLCPVPVTHLPPCETCVYPTMSTSIHMPPPETHTPPPPVHPSSSIHMPPPSSSVHTPPPPVMTLSTVAVPSSSHCVPPCVPPPVVTPPVVPPPVVTPCVYPCVPPSVTTPPYVHNTTTPPVLSTPVVSHPPPVVTAGAAQNVQKAGAVLVAGVMAAYVL